MNKNLYSDFRWSNVVEHRTYANKRVINSTVYEVKMNEFKIVIITDPELDLDWLVLILWLTTWVARRFWSSGWLHEWLGGPLFLLLIRSRCVLHSTEHDFPEIVLKKSFVILVNK